MEEKKKKSLLMMDIHNLIYRCVHVATKEDPLDENFTLWKYLVFNNILTNIKLYDADRVILAIDSRKYWRKKVYSGYKAQRKAAREESPIDFDKFFPVMEEFFNEFENTFKNIMFLKIDECEADDIIGILTKHELSEYNIVNISNDKDMYQLLKFKNYRQFDPIKKKMIQHLNPERYLLEKILTGDKSDNIPAVKEKCGPKTAQKMIDMGLENALLNDSMKENFDRNKQLIDMDLIPYNIKKVIQDTYRNHKVEKYNGQKTFGFLTKHKLTGMIEKLQEFSTVLHKLS